MSWNPEEEHFVPSAPVVLKWSTDIRLGRRDQHSAGGRGREKAPGESHLFQSFVTFLGKAVCDGFSPQPGWERVQFHSLPQP